jgi:spore germination protein KC
MKKKAVLIILMLATMLLLSGCWSSHEVNTLGLTVAIGIDKSKAGYLISEQVINPRTITTAKQTNRSPVTVLTSEGEDIHEAIARMTTLTPRRIYSSHLRMVILGEDIAREGIADIVDYLMRYHEYRTDFYFAIAKGFTANEILNILTPIETIPGMELFDKLKMSFEEWAPTNGLRIVELANDIMTDGVNPAINRLEIVGGDEKTNSTDVLKKTDGYEVLKFTDIGAFNKDKLVGWLNEDESKGYNYIRGTVMRSSGYTAENGIEISFDIMNARSKIKVTVENNQPTIDVTIKSHVKIVGTKGGRDVSKLKISKPFKKMAENKCRNFCEDAVRKAQGELKTDIFGFGERVHSADPHIGKQ